MKISFIRKLQGLRFFSVSLVLHCILGLILSSVVVFKAVREHEGFSIPTEQAGFISQTDEPGDEPLAETAEFEEPGVEESAAANITQTVASAVVSFDQSSTSSFQAVSTLGQQAGVTIGGGSRLPAAVVSQSSIASSSGPSSSTFLGVPQVQGMTGLIGTFYDLKQTKDRQPTNLTPDEYGEIVADFVKGWNPGKLRRFYAASNTLVSPQVFTPEMPADVAPKAFAVEKEVQPMMWLVWYRARVSPPKTGNYHFVGAGDDILFVRFNGRTVLDRCWFLRNGDTKEVENYDYGFSLIKDGFAKGRSFRAEAGKFYDVDILIGEQPGGLFYASLLIEESGAQYEKDAKGNPILPIFRVGDEPLTIAPDQSYPPFAKNGPVWRAQPPGASN